MESQVQHFLFLDSIQLHNWLQLDTGSWDAQHYQGSVAAHIRVKRND
jgi:hypothetical protein